jgi:iron complex transport system permease protein
MKSGNITLKVSLIFLLALSAFVFTPLMGDSHINLVEAIRSPGSVSAQVLLHVRLPRIIFAWLVGCGLALIGSVFQALLRNDMATPYTLGVSSGGAFGAVVAIKTGLAISIAGFSTTALFSIAGSLLTIILIYFIAYGRRNASTVTIVLAGVTISLFFSALILFVHYLADYTETYRMVRWLMGALDISGWEYPSILGVLVAMAFTYFFYHAPAFNLLLAGNEMARSKGVNVIALQKASFFIASVLVGVIVSMAGPIGFIGLIIPHILRLLFGPDHRLLFPLVLISGGAFLVWCDTIARLIIAPAEVPVGIITSLLGGPFFIFLLIRHRRS